MDVRDSTNPMVLTAARWLDVVNSRHPWNHNEHFHGWILRNLPARRQAAVDVGCGTGVLAGTLASHFARVTGIDADEGMSAAATARLAGDPRVSIVRCGFDEFAAAAGQSEVDLITMVAVLHHLDLGDTLARIPGLLAPGGRLLVVGLAKVDSLADVVVDLISTAANPVMGVIKHPRPARQPDPADGQPVMPVRDPTRTLAEIGATASARMPGATIRRRLYFRYTLRWDKPAPATCRRLGVADGPFGHTTALDGKMPPARCLVTGSAVPRTTNRPGRASMNIEIAVPEEWTPGQALVVRQLLQHGVRTGQPVIAFVRKDVSPDKLKEVYDRVNTLISEAGLEPT